MAEDYNQSKSPMDTENKTAKPKRVSPVTVTADESVSGLDVRQLLGLGRSEPETAPTIEAVEIELRAAKTAERKTSEAAPSSLSDKAPVAEKSTTSQRRPPPTPAPRVEEAARAPSPLQRPDRPAFDTIDTKPPPAEKPPAAEKIPEPAIEASVQPQLDASFNDTAKNGGRPIPPITQAAEIARLRPSIDPLAASAGLAAARSAGVGNPETPGPATIDPSIAANAKLAELASLSERTLEEYETFDDFDDATPQRSKRTPIIILASLLSVGVLAGGVVFAYRQGVKESVQTSLPIIVAEKKAVKEKPSTPGGVNIPHQNKLIYDRILGEETDIAEKIVPREEKVVSLSRKPAFTTVTKTVPTAKVAVPSAPAAPGTPTNPVTSKTPAPANGLEKVTENATRSLGSVTPPKPLSPPDSLTNGSAVVSELVVPEINTTPVIIKPEITRPLTETLNLPPKNQGQTNVNSEAVVQTVPATKTPEAPSTSATPGLSAESLAIAKLVEETTEIDTGAVAETKLPPVLPRRKPPVPSVQSTRVASIPAPTQTPPASTARSSAGRFVIQIAAFRSQEEALSRYTTLKRRHSSLLSPYTSFVQRADLGDRGVYYRLRLGPIDGRDKASTLCRSLLSAGEKDCLVRTR